MFERLTELARRVVSSAGEESDRLGHNYVGCEHVMAGIARQVDSAAARVLGAHGLDLPAIRADLDRLIDRGILPPPWHNDHELLGSLGVDLDAVLRSMEDARSRRTASAVSLCWRPASDLVTEDASQPPA